MLSLFPSLFDYSAVAVTVLRITVAIIFIMQGYKKLLKKGATTTFYENFIPIMEITLGVFFLAGFFTQIVSIILGAVSVRKLYIEYKNTDREQGCGYFNTLLFIISFSFLFLGPGLWSIDYPL